MHRLLSYKGYTFPEVKAEDASVLNPSDNLKSLEEIQKEEQIAQSAKLQELVRRGRPSDLKEANKLMKIMAGFKDDNLVESRAKVAEDLDRLKRKCDIFSEMLQASENAGKLDTTDETLVELYSALKVAQPKIQKIIGEEADDEEAVQNLLKLNDTVNSLMEKYNLLKSGDVANASKIKVSGAGSGALESLSLIDFGDDGGSSSSTPPPAGSNTVDDLLGDLTSLNFSSTSNANTFGVGGDITLGSVSPQPQSPQQSSGPNYDIFSQLSSPQPTNVAPAVHNNSTSSAFDLLGGFSSPPPPPPQQQQQSSSFTTTTPIVVNQSNNVKFDLIISRESSSTILAKALFSNLTASSISNFQFLVAIPKHLQLRLEPQSGTFIPSFGQNSITQVFRVDNATSDTTVKIKWKINYTHNGSPVEETNTFTFPSV